MKILYKLSSILIKFGTEVLLCRIDAPDFQKIPSRGPLIVITNHTGQLEVPVFFGQLTPRPITGWAKAELWDSPFTKWLFNLWGLIPLQRGDVDTSALRSALKALDEDYIFGIAPEGTRNKTGRLKRGHPGAVMLAVHSGAPILPVAHWGGEIFLKNLKHLKRTDFHIRVGEPFRLELEGVKMTRETRQQIVDEMMIKIAELLPKEYRGEYENSMQGEKKFTQTIELPR
jgi:1-acyl-sn-glycerol-3-phosphate acyltransferase